VHAGQLPGPKQPPGERLSLNQVDLRLLGQKDLDLPKSDPELTREVVGLLGRMADRYAIAVLDVSDPAAPRYAEHGGEVRRNPGSVGKLCAALAVFQALADVYPQDEAARVRVLSPDFSPVVWKKAVPRGIICSGSTGYADRRGRPYEHRV
jgi:hypothetical protein